MRQQCVAAAEQQQHLAVVFSLGPCVHWVGLSVYGLGSGVLVVGFTVYVQGSDVGRVGCPVYGLGPSVHAHCFF